MNVRKSKKVWGGVFTGTVAFVALLALDILANKATTASFIYANSGLNHVPAEVLFLIVLVIPVTAVISGIQFLRYFVKARKQRKQPVAVELNASHGGYVNKYALDTHE